VLVLREVTERPEGVHAGIAKIVGSNETAILSSALGLMNNEDGMFTHMSRYVVACVASWFLCVACVASWSCVLPVLRAGPVCCLCCELVLCVACVSSLSCVLAVFPPNRFVY
jgi:hypothetical protein